MNKVVVLVLLMIGTTTMAQEKRSHHRGNMNDMTPAQIATLQTKKMTLALDLSKVQQDQIQALNLENAKAKKAKMDKRKAQKEEGERKKPTSEERFTMRNQHLDAKIAVKNKLKEILSDEQLEKWEKMHHHKRGHGRKGHRSRKEKARR